MPFLYIKRRILYLFDSNHFLLLAKNNYTFLFVAYKFLMFKNRNEYISKELACQPIDQCSPCKMPYLEKTV